MISCKNISATRNGEAVLDSINFSVNPGECLLIRGENGSGKTTLLKIIAGLISPVSGDVTLQNKSIFKESEELAGSSVYIGHKNGMNLNLSIQENLNFWAKLYGSEEMVDAAIKYFSLDDFSEKKVKYLSEGEKRKTALAKLLCCNCPIWILDEPTTNLDKNAIDLLLGLINTKIQNGGLAIISTHSDMNLSNSKTLQLQ